MASGTATIEAALLGTPMVVIYRVSRTTAAILRHMIRTPFIGMVEPVAGRRVVPELIQDDFTPAAVAAELRYLLESPDARDEMIVPGSRKFAQTRRRRRYRAGGRRLCADVVRSLSAPGNWQRLNLVS